MLNTSGMPNENTTAATTENIQIAPADLRDANATTDAQDTSLSSREDDYGHNQDADSSADPDQEADEDKQSDASILLHGQEIGGLHINAR